MSLLEQIANGLGVEVAYVQKLCRTASTHYRLTKIPKANGRKRQIWIPSPELKAAQRLLVRTVLRKLPVHHAATAYEPGSTIRDNASRHRASRYLLRMDLRKFFESITKDDVCAFMNDAGPTVQSAWTPDDTQVFAALVCWQSHLVIGSVTSPTLTNRMCFELDRKLATRCDAIGVVYSRYADDLFFSSTAPDVLRGVEADVVAILHSLKSPAGLRVNKSKTHHTSKRRRRTVTGLVLTSTGEVSLGRERKRKVRAMVDQFENLSPPERAWLKGTLGFCRDIEPQFVDRLVLKYGAARLAAVLAPAD